MSGECGIRNVVEIAAAFEQRLGGDLRIDARGLASADVAVLQLLVSASKSAAATGHDMSIDVEPGGVLQLAVDRAGLAPMFRDILRSSAA
ncbi:hypothetical protein ATO4_26025 [Aurantimonas sp. 22II-16-19i]|nr:hypothetical protein ATO4_26025 [Aurantimonas sp. 22II-16-19i]